tara:strand:+ start:10440 stop:11738 length:1299 start_codon:yes stop_codon:yes gene_type:complete
MSVSNLTTEQTYDGTGSQSDFAVAFDLIDNTVIVVTLIDELTVDTATKSGFAETLQTITTHYTLDADPATLVQMVTDPTTDQKLRVERVSPLTQPTDLQSGVDGEEATETQLDKIVHVIQELDARIDAEEAETGATAAVNAVAPDWITATAYTLTQLVVQNGTLYRCETAHTSNSFDTDYLSNGYWIKLLSGRGPAGLDGSQGLQGATGATGGTGSNGAAGADGDDGLIVAIASQGEAQAGTENTKAMTSLRVAEAILAQVPVSQITTNQNAITAANAAANVLQSRVTVLESLIQQATGKFAGQQILLNTQAVAVPLIGLLNGGVLDQGAGLWREESGTNFAKVQMYVRRITTTEERFSSWDLIMQYVDGAWLIGRDATDQLDATLTFDGVTLSVATDGSGRGQVSYISDTMAGADHDDASIIAWLGQEISK